MANSDSELLDRIKAAKQKMKQLEAERKVKLDREKLKRELLAEIHSETLSIVDPTKSYQ